ncbi:MAG: hypothetical protein ACLT3W_07150 [Bifidobacterium pseudocatenulatum]
MPSISCAARPSRTGHGLTDGDGQIHDDVTARAALNVGIFGLTVIVQVQIAGFSAVDDLACPCLAYVIFCPSRDTRWNMRLELFAVGGQRTPLPP